MPLYPPRLVPLALTVTCSTPRIHGHLLRLAGRPAGVCEGAFARVDERRGAVGSAAAAAGAALMWANPHVHAGAARGERERNRGGMLALIASACLFVVVGQLRAELAAAAPVGAAAGAGCRPSIAAPPA
jgi:hypothetical protein